MAYILNPVDNSSMYKIENAQFTNGGTGNLAISDFPANGIPIAIEPVTGNTDCYITFFKSIATGKWYVHCANFSTGDAISNPNMNGCTLYYLTK